MRRMTNENEVNACNAFIDILKKIKGVEYEIDSSPEKENRKTPDVLFRTALTASVIFL